MLSAADAAAGAETCVSFTDGAMIIMSIQLLIYGINYIP